MTAMITESTLKDLTVVKENYSALMFYWWITLRYENRSFTIEDGCKNYYRSKRTIQRYMAVLKDLDLIEVARKGSHGQKKRFKIKA